jgi:hypothetical protein
MLAVADGGADHGRLQAGERALQQAVFARAGGATDSLQKLIGCESQKARCAQAAIFRFDDLLAAQISTSASQIVAMPCSGIPWTSTRCPPDS